MRNARLPLSLLTTVSVALATLAAETSDHHAGSLAKDEPQVVYSADPTDPWNRIFYCLFTRTVRTRLSDDFLEGKPFDTFQRMNVSRRTFERIESGDRAIEPFYPSSRGGSTTDTDGANQVMTEPLYSQLEKALEDALNEKTPRSPLARALMQSDVWAAHDILSRNYLAFDRDDGKQRLQRRDRLVKLLAQFVRKLALAPEEIKALPDTYATAANVHRLPDLFGADTAWLEIRWSEKRIHDSAADYRRAARVFLKPASTPKDRAKLLDGLRQAQNVSAQLDAVALVTQTLLIDSTGKVVPTPLVYEVQVRTFVKDRDGKPLKTEAKQFELSRKLLLDTPKSGGFVALGEQAPVYLSDAGNDYSFASVQHKPVSEPILVRLATRCTSCHGKSGVMTFAMHGERDQLPPVALLKPSENEHARYVAGRKVKRKEFQALQERWGSPR